MLVCLKNRERNITCTVSMYVCACVYLRVCVCLQACKHDPEDFSHLYMAPLTTTQDTVLHVCLSACVCVFVVWCVKLGLAAL